MKKTIPTTSQNGFSRGGIRCKNHSLLRPAGLALAAFLAAAQCASAAPYTWNVSSGNWSTPTSWTPSTPAGGPLPTDTVIFGVNDTSSSSSTPNNIVDAGFAGTISSMLVNSTNIGTFHVTQIGPSQTLTITNSLIIGNLYGVQWYSQEFMVGGGTLIADGTTNFNIENYGSASGAGSTATLDLSGLNTFIYSNSTGTISIADTGPSPDTRAGGTLVLASGSNFVDVATINVGTSASAQAGPNDNFTFGTGTNVIYVGTLNLANNKNSVTNSFKNSTGGLRLRGVAGTDSSRATIILGNRNQSGTGTCSGNMLLNGSPVDIKAGNLIVGTNNSAGTTGDTGTGVLQFDTGVIDATTVIMGASVTALGAANGTITVGAHGILNAGLGGISLVTQTSTGVGTGILNISNGTVNCTGNIFVGSAAGSSTINIIGSGDLNIGANSHAGTPTLPIGTLTLDTNSIIDLDLPSTTQTNICVSTLNWPSTDTGLTFILSAIPGGLTAGSTFPLISFSSLNGTVVAPQVVLPPGVTGTISQTGNLIQLTITGGGGPGIGGINQLANPGFELNPSKVDWQASGNTPIITVGSATYYNNPSGACTPDATAELVVSHTGSNVANIYGNFTGGYNTSSWAQTLPATAGSTFTSGAFTYVSHEDLMTGKNSFHYTVNFLDSLGNSLASYESYVVSNLTCGETTPFPVDTWVFLAVTNQMKISNGTNAEVVTGNVPSSVLTAPPGTISAQFEAIFVQQGPPDQYDGGSVYLDDANLGIIGSPVIPSLTAITPNLVTLCTNTAITCTASSTLSVITNVQVITRTTTLGGITTNTITNGLGSSALTVTGTNTATANISFALTPNTIYRSIVVVATDANGSSVTSPAAVLDTLQPTLVIEASDFNYSGGQFMDTPANGGLALYTNQVGEAGIDENKAARASTQSYYRPQDAVIIEAAAPQTGSPPSSTEQKFVTAAANGDTNDVEVEVGFNTPGDWLDYTRNYGSGGSAPTGTYNLWCYEATSGTGVQGTISIVTSDPTQANQTTTTVGNIGTSTFTDNGYNNYVYVPVVDQFGNQVSITLSNKVTLRSTVVGNPNLGFYMLTPVAPVITPSFEHIYPDGSKPFQYTNQFSFTVSPAQGAAIDSSGISLVLNGVNVSSLLNLTSSNGVWSGTYPLNVNSTYTGVLSVTNEAALSATDPLNFDTFNITNYMWEAVDYDFSTNSQNGFVSALFIDNPVPTCDINAAQHGTFATNSYFGYPTGFAPNVDPFGTGAVAQQGIDINFPDDGQAAGNSVYYRADGVGSQPATDYLRPKFIAAQQEFGDPNIGQLNIGYWATGYWLNYTHNYPTNTFYVWGRLSGGAGAFSGTTLSVVTSGVGTPNQVSNVIGSFSDAAPAGWQSYHWIPLRDTNGNMAKLTLGGKATLKLTSGNNLNALFYMLAPAPINPMLTTTVSNGMINISLPTLINHTYTLMHSTTLTSGYSQVGSSIPGDGLTHILVEPITGSQGFYRVHVQ